MGGILKIVLALLLSIPLAFLGWALAKDPGRMSLHFWGWQIDTTLVLACILLATVLMLFWLLAGLLWYWPRRLLRRRQEQLAAQFRFGLLDLAQGQFAKAKKRLLAAAARTDQSGIALLSASQAAAELGDHTEAQALLTRAMQSENTRAAAEVLQHQLSLQKGDLTALDSLHQLSEQGSVKASLLLARTLSQRQRGAESLQAWQRVQKLAPGSASSEQWAEMARLALQQAHTAEQLQSVWAQLSEREHGQIAVLTSYVRQAVKLDQVDAAFDVLYPALKTQACQQHWQLLTEVANKLSESQSAKVQKLTRDLGENPSQALLIAQAKLLRLSGDKTLASSTLLRAVELGDSAELSWEQAEAAFHSGDFHAAALAFQKARRLA